MSILINKQRQAHFTIGGQRRAAWTREGQTIAEGEPLFVIWKMRGGPIACDAYQGGWGYAGHIPTDKASAQWHAERATERLKAQYHWQQDVVFEVIPYQQAP
jgi:hypothetical protein